MNQPPADLMQRVAFLASCISPPGSIIEGSMAYPAHWEFGRTHDGRITIEAKPTKPERPPMRAG